MGLPALHFDEPAKHPRPGHGAALATAGSAANESTVARRGPGHHKRVSSGWSCQLRSGAASYRNEKQEVTGDIKSAITKGRYQAT